MNANRYNGSRLTAHGSRLTAHGLNLSSQHLSHNKPKFVIFGRPIGGTCAAAEEWGALLNHDLNNKFLTRLFWLHSMAAIRGIFDSPGKGLWDSLLFDTKRLCADDDIYFIFYEGFRFAYSPNYLRHLRKKYKHSRLIHCFRNPMCAEHATVLRKWDSVRDYYDASVTLCRADAERLGILFCEYWPSVLPDKDFQPENASDVFFIAQAKDRLPKMLEVYERLTDAGLKCEFHITGVSEEKQRHPESIHYNEWLSYDDVLQCVKNTKCVLEILPYGQNYSSLRVSEALWYHKKLLTTNLDAPQEWFYHPDTVQCFTEAKDIDPEFITRPLSAEDEQAIFSQRKVPDFDTFVEWVIKNVG